MAKPRSRDLFRRWAIDAFMCVCAAAANYDFLDFSPPDVCGDACDLCKLVLRWNQSEKYKYKIVSIQPNAEPLSRRQ